MVSRLAEHEAHPPERGGENLVVVGQGPQRLDDAGLDIDEGVRVDAGRRAIRLRKDDVEGNRHDPRETEAVDHLSHLDAGPRPLADRGKAFLVDVDDDDGRGDGLTRIGELVKVEDPQAKRSEEHTSELQSLMRISYAVFCLKKKNTTCTP